MLKDMFVYATVCVFTLTVPVIGLYLFGIATALMLLSGYWMGFVFWVAAINKAPPKLFFKLYWITFLLFIVHRAKEKVTGIFEAISNFAGITKPETTLMLAFALIVLSVGSWAIAPLLIKKEYPFGYYFAWTFLAYTSISELVHLIFVGGRGAEGFFGVFGAALLASVACWGMFKLSQRNN